MTKRTHYQVLGVQPDAEDLVIKAAYRALAQRYHPDKWDGDKVFAQQRMAEINAAYAVLSDAAKRREYDTELKSTGGGQAFEAESEAEDVFDEYFKEREDDWIFALKFHPEVKAQFDHLRMINFSLGDQFKILLLETRGFKNSKNIFEKMRNEFLSRHFGTNKEILTLAQFLISEGNKKALLGINRAVRVLGNDVSPIELALKFGNEWNLSLDLVKSVVAGRIVSDRGLNLSDLKVTKRKGLTWTKFHCAKCGLTDHLTIENLRQDWLISIDYLACQGCGNMIERVLANEA